MQQLRKDYISELTCITLLIIFENLQVLVMFINLTSTNGQTVLK